MRFARAEAQRYGGDPSNLSLFGHSAGANFASIVAFADPEISKGCLVPSGSILADNLVLFDGDWLIVGADWWDDLLREDPWVADAFTPWSYLEEADRIPVQILDSGDPELHRSAEGAGRWLALRDPTGNFYRELEELGAFDDGVVTELEAQRLLHGRLLSLRYQAAFHVLPDSSHTSLTEAGLQLLVAAILAPA